MWFKRISFRRQFERKISTYPPLEKRITVFVFKESHWMIILIFYGLSTFCGEFKARNYFRLLEFWEDIFYSLIHVLLITRSSRGKKWWIIPLGNVWIAIFSLSEYKRTWLELDIDSPIFNSEPLAIASHVHPRLQYLVFPTCHQSMYWPGSTCLTWVIAQEAVFQHGLVVSHVNNFIAILRFQPPKKIQQIRKFLRKLFLWFGIISLS